MSLDPTVHQPRDPYPVCGEIARNVSQVLVTSTGRGPNRIRTFIDDNLVTVLIEDGLTRAERTLVHHDQAPSVLHNRGMLQAALQAQYVAIVTSATGRTVTAFLSGSHIDPDVEIESFLLDRPI